MLALKAFGPELTSDFNSSLFSLPVLLGRIEISTDWHKFAFWFFFGFSVSSELSPSDTHVILRKTLSVTICFHFKHNPYTESRRWFARVWWGGRHWSEGTNLQL